MSGCLQEETLVLVQAGEETQADREHLAACQACGGRYRELTEDLEAITRALEGEPPTRPVLRHGTGARRVWLPLAAAGFATAGALVWGLWFGRATGPVILLETRSAETAPVLQLVSATLFSAIEAGPLVPAAEMAGLYDFQAALEGESRCEWAQVFTSGCETSWAHDDVVDLAGGGA